jgi:hypothetical protein
LQELEVGRLGVAGLRFRELERFAKGPELGRHHTLQFRQGSIAGWVRGDLRRRFRENAGGIRGVRAVNGNALELFDGLLRGSGVSLFGPRLRVHDAARFARWERVPQRERDRANHQRSSNKGQGKSGAFQAKPPITSGFAPGW